MKQLSTWASAALIYILASPLGAASEVSSEFHRGQALYAQARFEEAVAAFESAVATMPQRSDYHHWLAKAYGRLAETSGWVRAIELAKHTREALEKAVALDPQNAEAVADLLEYYKLAPKFLGGGKDKAEQLELRLKSLDRTNLSSAS